MARKRRGEIAAGVYHVTIRTAGRIPLFVDDVDRTDFCNRLARVVGKSSWICLAFCLMTTHYHLLIEVPENALQPGMQYLNGPYAQQFNRRHGRSGHLFGDRYYSVPVLTDGHLLHLLAYFATNPVKAGLCKKPSDWLWGSYRGCAGLDRGFAFVDSSVLRSYFGADGAAASRLIRAFVGDLDVAL